MGFFCLDGVAGKFCLNIDRRDTASIWLYRLWEEGEVYDGGSGSAGEVARGAYTATLGGVKPQALRMRKSSVRLPGMVQNIEIANLIFTF